VLVGNTKKLSGKQSNHRRKNMTKQTTTAKKKALTSFTDRDGQTLGRVVSKLIEEACTDTKTLGLLKAYHALLSTAIEQIEKS
jgi:hypothetical protein